MSIKIIKGHNLCNMYNEITSNIDKNQKRRVSATKKNKTKIKV